MSKALIKLAFRHEIHAQSVTTFEKDVFTDSYNEFLLQAQAYNREGNFYTLEEMISNNPKANSLHYKVGFAVGLYVAGLQNMIPNIKTLVPGAVQPGFQSHQFEIIHSDISDRTRHRVAVIFYTGIVTLLDSFGENLLLAAGDLSHLSANEWTDTFMLKPGGNTSIYQYSPLQKNIPASRMLP